MFWSCQHTFTGQLVPVAASYPFNDFREVVDSKILIHFGNLLFEIFFVAFSQTAHHEKMVDLTCLFGLYKAEDGVDRLLFGVTDKTTGVYDHYFGIGRVGVVDDIEIVVAKLCHQML